MKNRISFRGGQFKSFRYILILAIVVISVLVIRGALASSPASTSQTSEKVVLKTAAASKSLNKDVSITLTDENGDEAESLTMKLETVEVRDEIVVQGQKATSVAGRSFFVVNMKLINPLKQAVEVNTKDYVRLAEQDSSEWLAPDIHNDPVVIQAISTKPTRIAFPVNADARRFKLQVGEITGEKEVIEIDFNQ